MSIPRRSLATLALLVSLSHASPATALSGPDSLANLRGARQEQARFELLRRRNLPATFARGGGRCDERIGRFCLTRDSGQDWVAPPEHRAVAPARDRLIARLAAAARVSPGDRWITGQRVRYLVEAKRFADARAAALECRAEPWWCSALSGFAAHYAGAAAAADSTFSAMTTAMPPRVYEQWTDVSSVLEPELLRELRRLADPARQRLLDSYWGLADPFYGRPGNEVRSEHFARNLLDDLQDRAKSTDNLRWGSDLRELLLRFGWPTGWERIKREQPYITSETSYVSHYADVDYDILPPTEIFLDGAGLAAGEWDVERLDARATYALPLGDSLLSWLPPPDHQFAVFHRGDSLALVGAYSLPADSFPPDSVPECGALEAVLATTADGLAPGPVVRLAAAPATAALTLRLAPGAMVASLELVSEGSHRAARARRGLAPAPIVPGRLAVSDLLLLRESPALPQSLEQAAAVARGSTRVRPGESVGVYWEVYGFDGQQTGELTMTLRIVGGERGWLRRAAERARIVRAAEAVSVRWQEPLEPGAILARALALQVPTTTRREYTIELSVALPGEEPLVARQLIEVREEPEQRGVEPD